MTDRVGQHLGNYRLIRLLGRGGQASVYLGEHVYLNSHAALKVLHTSLQDEDVERFLSEARTLVRLSHPHIVRVLEFTVEQGTPVLMMEYAPEGTVRTRYPRGSALPLPIIVDYLRQVAAALQYAHTRNVIHRDVKPENMLLGPQQTILLSDFGLALLSPSPDLLSTQELAGTIPYIAPEQIRGKPCFASDQYALGIVTYEWLCGSCPFEGSPWQVLQQHLSEAPPPLRHKNPGLPEALEEVVHKALAKEPQERFVSVQSFARAFARASQVRFPSHSIHSQTTASLEHGPDASGSTLPPASQQVFLSAAPADEVFAARLQADLQTRGVQVGRKRVGHMPEVSEQQELLRQAIRAASLVLLILSPQTRSSRSIKEHLRIADLYERRVLFVWAAGEAIDAVLPSSESWGQRDVIDARGTRYVLALEELLAYLQEDSRPTASLALPFAELRGEPRNPYKGLRAFRQHDAADFFGRDVLIQELVDALRGLLMPDQLGAPQSRLLAVMGASGSGKSSVVLAGVLPRLQRGGLQGSERWVYLEAIVPGQHPIESLALTLAPHFPDRSVKSLREDLEDESARGLHLLATPLAMRAKARVVLVLDQCEELFTLTTTEQERRHFIDLLVTAVTEPHGPLIALLTLRADFYDRILSSPQLGRLIESHHRAVLPMETQDLRAVIEQPAALPDVQLTFEGNLVGDLLFEAQGQVGVLPLLEFTLEHLFQRRNGHTLTQEAYRQIGGVKGALVRHAEATYAALPSEEHRRLTRFLFLRLIDPGMTEQDMTRRRATLAELTLPNLQETTLLRAVMEAFVAARLLTINERAERITVEVSHEALIREWPRLSDWLREGREDLRLQQAISEDVAAWKQRGRPKDRLYRGVQLVEARAWASRNLPSSDEVAFIQASINEEERQRIVERAQQRRELELQRRAARRQRYVIGMMAVTSVVLIAGLVISLLLQENLLATQNQLLTSLPVSVTNLNDHGPGSLREAIAHANSGDAITFAKNVKGIVTLTSGELQLTKSISVNGPGRAQLSISGSNSSRVFSVRQGIFVTISNLTVMNGSAREGAGIKNDGSLVLINSRVIGNKASFEGGGITNNNWLKIVDSTVSNNTSLDSSLGTGGGGIFNIGILSVENSTISNNTASDGGGVWNHTNPFGLLLSQVDLMRSTISSNTAQRGGGIWNDGTLNLTSSTVSANRASDEGGGIWSLGELTVDTSTISANTSQRGGGLQTGGNVGLSYSTIYNNTSRIGGGIAAENASSDRISLWTSIVGGNHAVSYPDIQGGVTLNGPNLIEHTSGVNIVLGYDLPALIQKSPLLGPLQNNGGPTQTHALLRGSPAIDQIPHKDYRADPCGLDPITDQRGIPRPQGAACDIGAYEYVASSHA